MNNSFDRTIVNQLERPLSTDINQLQSNEDYSTRDLLDAETLTRSNSGTFPDAAVSPRAYGFLGDGFKVRPNASGADGNVYITAGRGFYDTLSDNPVNINGISGLDDVPRLKPIILTSVAPESASGVAVPAAPGAGNSRIDIIEVRYNRVVTDPASRDVLNPSTGTFQPQSVTKTMQWLLDGTLGYVAASDTSTTNAIKYKSGVVSATTNPDVPAVPTTTPGYIKIAEIFVTGTVTTFDSDVINDTRPYLLPNGMTLVSATFKLQRLAGPILKATTTNVVAPPGVVVAMAPIVGGFTPVQGYVVIAIGASAGYTVVSTAAVAVQTSNSTSVPGTWDESAGAFTSEKIDTVIQSSLADSTQVSPVVKMAAGQVALVAILEGLNTNSGTHIAFPATNDQITANLQVLLQRNS